LALGEALKELLPSEKRKNNNNNRKMEKTDQRRKRKETVEKRVCVYYMYQASIGIDSSRCRSTHTHKERSCSTFLPEASQIKNKNGIYCIYITTCTADNTYMHWPYPSIDINRYSIAKKKKKKKND
jgi:hypothetical protein